MKRNRFRTCLCLSFFFLSLLPLKAQDNQVSGLNARQFHKYWKVESESPDYKVTFRGDSIPQRTDSLEKGKDERQSHH